MRSGCRGAPDVQGCGVRQMSVQRLSPDGRSLVLAADGESFEVRLADVLRAQQSLTAPPPYAAAAGDGPPRPTPREIQQRIRHGEASADIARGSGLPVEAVERYESPVLAEREHQARLLQRAEVDGRAVGELVEQHMTRMGQDASTTTWDCWLIEPPAWEARARCGREVVRLGWDAKTRRVRALDETGRHALDLVAAPQDALDAVLRPVSARPSPPRPSPTRPEPAPRQAGRRGRASVPEWADISTSVAGRRRGGDLPDRPGEGA